jgi:hypothetical protein
MAWTQPVRWKDIHRSAIILGLIPSNTQGDNMRVRALLLKRISEGKVQQLTHGQPKALYRGKYKHEVRGTRNKPL